MTRISTRPGLAKACLQCAANAPANPSGARRLLVLDTAGDDEKAPSGNIRARRLQAVRVIPDYAYKAHGGRPGHDGSNGSG